MEYKERKEPIPEEIKDEQLDKVTGGSTLDDWIATTVQMSTLSDNSAMLEKEAEEIRQAALNGLNNAPDIRESALSSPAAQPLKSPEDML